MLGKVKAELRGVLYAAVFHNKIELLGRCKGRGGKGANEQVVSPCIVSVRTAGSYVIHRQQPLANGKHLRLKLRRENCDYSAVMFNVPPEKLPFKIGDTVDLAVTLDVNVYNNTESVSVIVRNIRKSGINEAETEKQLSAIERVYSNSASSTEAELIFPLRDEIAVVFRYVRENSGVSLARAENDLLEKLSIGKITVALTALAELKLIDNTDGVLTVVPVDGKVDLDSADILRKIKALKAGDIV